jgi:hypothetical protein
MNFTDFEAGVASRIQDNSHKLSQADQDAFINQAVKGRYSKDRPRELVTDVAGNSTKLLPLPAGPSNPAEPFEDGFSQIRALEYPIGDVPPSYLEDDAWLLYRTPTGLKIQLRDQNPVAADAVRVTWTVRHTPGTTGQNPVATTVPDADFEAVCDLAAALCCEALAARFAQTNDSTVSADVVNYRTKSQEYLAMAKALRKRYDDHVGIQDSGSGTGGSSTPGALAVGDMEINQGSGVERVTHRKR